MWEWYPPGWPWGYVGDFPRYGALFRRVRYVAVPRANVIWWPVGDGEPGPPGPQGPPGPRGSRWFTGHGDPTPPPADAQTGDMYLDLASGGLWEFTVSGFFERRTGT